MNKYLLALSSILLLVLDLQSQCASRLFPAYSSQAEINELAEEFGMCDTLYGDLQITFNEHVEEKDRITDLSPLKFVKYISGSLSIDGIDEIKDLNGFKSLTYVDGGLWIANCNDLLNIDKVEELDYIKSLFVQDNPLLERMPDLLFDSLDFAVFSNLNVSDLQFLSEVRKIERLDVFSNSNLSSCAGLNDEIQLGKVILRENPNLTECAVDEICTKIGQNVDEVVLINNGEGCSLIEELALQCYPDSLFCFQDYLELKGQDEVNEILNIEVECLSTIREIKIGDGNNSIPVTDLSPLLRFRSLELLHLNRLDSLQSLDGVQNLEYINVIIVDRCNLLTSLEAFDGNIQIGSGVHLTQNEALNNLGSFLTSRPIPEVFINSSDQLNQGEYDKLDKVHGIGLHFAVLENANFINENPNLQKISLRELEGVTELNLQNSPGITDLSLIFQSDPLSLTNIVFADSVNSISLSYNNIPNFNVLNPPLIIDYFSLLENTFQSFDFISMANQIRFCNFVRNAGIVEIDFLDSLEYIDLFYVGNNNDLISIGNTSNLIHNLRDFSVRNNPLLESIEGFSNNIISSNIEIGGNPNLMNCDLGIVCNTLASKQGDVSLSGNGGDCDFDSTVIACGIPNPLRSVTIKNQVDIDELVSSYPLMDSIFGSLNFDWDFGIEESDVDLSFFENLNYIQDEFRVDGSTSSYFDFSYFDNCSYQSLNISHVEAMRMPVYHGNNTIFQLILIDCNFQEGLIDFPGLQEASTIWIESFLDISDNTFTDLRKVHNLKLGNIDLADMSFRNLDYVNNIEFINLKVDNIEMFQNTFVQWGIRLEDCHNIINIDLDQFTYAYDQIQLVIENNNNLESISGLNVERSYRRFLIHIRDNVHLENLTILQAAKRVGFFTLYNNEILESLILPSLEQSPIIEIEENSKLVEINLNSINCLSRLRIQDNISLTHLQNIKNDADIGTLEILDNTNLSDCNVELICHNINLGNAIEIEGNSEPCTYEEIASQCTNAVSEEQERIFQVYPNPTQGIVASDAFQQLDEVVISNMFGITWKIKVVDGNLDLSDLEAGLYQIKIIEGSQGENALVLKL